MGILDSIKRLFRKQCNAHPDGIQLDAASDQRRSERRKLTKDELERVTRLQEVLSEAYPISESDWIAGFEADQNPEREIEIMEAVAVTYESTIQGITLEPDEKQALYQTLCVLSCNPDESLACSVPKLSSQWTTIGERYREARVARSRP